jgi:hypothetical protein
MYFPYVYEDRILKPVEMFQERGRGNEGEWWRGKI